MVKINLNQFVYFLYYLLNNTYSQKQLSGSPQVKTASSGATVIVQGTNNGTTSDFMVILLLMPMKVTFYKYFIGFQSQEITVTNENSYSITMISDNELEEVVLTGYGVIRKSDVTGSMSSLDSDDFNEGIVSNIDQLIQVELVGFK